MNTELLYYIFILYFTIILHLSFHHSKKELFEDFTNNPKLSECEIVISRYNEDIDWIKNEPFNKFNKITCYNKGPIQLKYECNSKVDKCRTINIINIENVGRCDHTFIYHIVKNYDDLAPITLFLPASCTDGHKFDITTKVIKKLNESYNTVLLGALFGDIPNDIYDFKMDEWKATNTKNLELNPEETLGLCEIRPYGNWYKENFGDLKVNVICYFGIFAVAREHIKQHPKERYEKLLKYLDHHSNPEAGHYMERSWAAIFHPYPESCVYDRNLD